MSCIHRERCGAENLKALGPGAGRAASIGGYAVKRTVLTIAVLILLIPSPSLAQEAAALAKPIVTVQTTAAIDLAWPAVSGADNYEIWAWDGSWTQLAHDTSTQFRHADFTPGTHYYYTVRATNDRGQRSPWSDYVSATGPAAATPAPTPTAAAVGVLTAREHEKTVILSWTPVAGAARYALWVWEENAGWQQIGGDNLTSTAYTHTGLTVGTTYYYTIAAVNADGVRGDWADYASATARPTLEEIYPTYQFQSKGWVGGVGVVALVGVSDDAFGKTKEVISAMMSERPDLLRDMNDYSAAVIIHNLPYGSAFASGPGGERENIELIGAHVPASDPGCLILIHEFAHMVHSALHALTDKTFDGRIQAMYQNAMGAGLWHNHYAATSFYEYWAESVVYWFIDLDGANSEQPIEEYDPPMGDLIEKTFGDAEVPEYCIP